MTWLVFLYVFTIGVENSDFVLSNQQYDWHGYTEFEASILLWERLEVGGSVNTKFVPSISGLPYFTPFQGDLIVFARYHIHPLLMIAFEHLCIHKYQDFFYRINYLGYNRLSLQISNK